LNPPNDIKSHKLFNEHWGARPVNAQIIAEHWKKNTETITKEDF